MVSTEWAMFLTIPSIYDPPSKAQEGLHLYAEDRDRVLRCSRGMALADVPDAHVGHDNISVTLPGLSIY